MATPKELYERSAKAFNDHDGDAIESLSSQDSVLSAPGDLTFTGPTQIRDFLQSWWDAFPDAHTIEREVLYAGTDTFVEEGTFHGIQDGVFRTPMGDIQPTHRPVSGEYISICKCRGDTIVSQYLLFDRMQLLEQLGLVPTAATA
jgi:predicted ester cyclase